MKTQINIKNGIILITLFLFSSVCWVNSAFAEHNIHFAEINTFTTLENNLNKVSELGKTTLLNNLDSDDSNTDITYEVDMTTNVELSIHSGSKFVVRLVRAVQSKGKYTVQWDTSGLPAGEYKVKLVTDYGTTTQTIVKQNSTSSLLN